MRLRRIDGAILSARAACAGVLVLLACAAPAQGAVVARDGDVVLRAKQQGGTLCLRLTRPDREPARECGKSPASPYAPLVIEGYLTGGRFAGAVTADVAEVGFGTETAEDRRVPTVAAKDFAARFVLERRRLPKRVQRFYDAQGRLIGARQSPNRIPQVDPVTLLRGGGQQVRFHVDRELAPTPLRPDRVVVRACVNGLTNQGGESFCDDTFFGDGTPTLAQVRTFRACAPQRTLAYGVTRASVHAIAFTLGSGRVVEVRTRRLPASYKGARGLVARLPLGAAVRNMVALGTAGYRQTLSEPPGGLPCVPSAQRANQGFVTPIFPRMQLDGVTIGRANARRVRAGDADGGLLCVGFGMLSVFDCGPPPVDGTPERVRVKQGAIAGVVAAQVAAVRVRFTEGPALELPTSAGSGYQGRFAGYVRFVTGTVPAGRDPRTAVALDADGRRVGTSRLFVEERFRPDGVGRVLLKAGNARLAITGGRFGSRCLGPLGGRFVSGGFCDRVGGLQIEAAAFCHPRTLLVWGQLGARWRHATIVLDDGDRVPARTFLGLGGRLFGAFVRPGTGLRAVVAGGTRYPFALPPAAQQCGYTDSLLSP